jgi:hypothetical protein
LLVRMLKFRDVSSSSSSTIHQRAKPHVRIYTYKTIATTILPIFIDFYFTLLYFTTSSTFTALSLTRTYTLILSNTYYPTCEQLPPPARAPAPLSPSPPFPPHLSLSVYTASEVFGWICLVWAIKARNMQITAISGGLQPLGGLPPGDLFVS